MKPRHFALIAVSLAMWLTVALCVSFGEDKKQDYLIFYDPSITRATRSMDDMGHFTFGDPSVTIITKFEPVVKKEGDHWVITAKQKQP